MIEWGRGDTNGTCLCRPSLLHGVQGCLALLEFLENSLQLFVWYALVLGLQRQGQTRLQSSTAPKCEAGRGWGVFQAARSCQSRVEVLE